MPRRPIGRRPGNPFRRPFVRRGFSGIPSQEVAGRGIPPALIAANQMFRSGQYNDAAASYLELANRGIEHGIRQAPHLYFQAARCYVMMGNLELALNLIRTGIDCFYQEERWADLYRSVLRSVTFFTEKGFSKEAQEVEHWLEEFIPPVVLENLKSSEKRWELPRQKIPLPAHCPSCGGTINPKEVEWVDEQSAICDFCGSIVRGE